MVDIIRKPAAPSHYLAPAHMRAVSKPAIQVRPQWVSCSTILTKFLGLIRQRASSVVGCYVCRSRLGVFRCRVPVLVCCNNVILGPCISNEDGGLASLLMLRSALSYLFDALLAQTDFF